MNWESERWMARDVREHPDLYDAFAVSTDP